MKKLTFEQIEKGTKGTIICGSGETLIEGVSTDSRKTAKTDIFFPLIGEKNDAHSFVPQVLERGCKNFIVSDSSCADMLLGKGGLNVIKVTDTTEALQDLAQYYIKLLEIKTIAVTGSTGKTSTKDMLKAVCGSKYKTYSNEGNFNNHIGVPLTILSFDRDAEIGVIEMGMDKFGEIKKLAEIVEPDIGIITNIGVSHIENLGSREGIFKAKMEITENFGRNNTLIVCRDEEFLNENRIKGDFDLVMAGETDKSNFIISHIDDFGAEGIQFKLRHNEITQNVKIPVPGVHNAYNASLAVAAGMQIGISMEQAAEALLHIELTDKRLAVKLNGGVKVIDDTYNASPVSMKAGIDVLCKTKGARRVAILGDMFELGDDTLLYHREVGEYAAKSGVDLVIAVGKLSEQIAAGALKYFESDKVKHYDKKEQFMKESDQIISDGDVVLVKGSRGMAMEEIVEKILKQ